MNHRVRILERQVQFCEDLDTRVCAWFGQIRAEIPYEWEIAAARRELARRRAKMTEKQIEKELGRIDGMKWSKYSQEFPATAGPYQDRDGAIAAVAEMVHVSTKVTPNRFKDFSDKLWYPEHGNCRPRRVEAQNNPEDAGQQTVCLCRVKIVERELEHQESPDGALGAWFGNVKVEVPTAWVVAREAENLARRCAKLTEKQIERAQIRIERLKRPPYAPHRHPHCAGPYQDRDGAVAAIEQMVDAAQTMTPDEHCRFCGTMWYPKGGFRPR